MSRITGNRHTSQTDAPGVNWRTTLRVVLVVLLMLVVLVALWWQLAVHPSLWEVLTDGANY